VIGDWALAIGDWRLGIKYQLFFCDPQRPFFLIPPNPQSLVPSP
jgi:hypothetical protein